MRPQETDFDQVTERLTRLFRVPIALLALIDKDRQWFKSQAGLPADLAEVRSTPRDVSVCGHVIANDDADRSATWHETRALLTIHG